MGRATPPIVPMNSRHFVVFPLLALAGAVIGWSWPRSDEAPAPPRSSGSATAQPAPADRGATSASATASTRELVQEPPVGEAPSEPVSVGVLLGLVVDATGRGMANASVSAIQGGGPATDAPITALTDAQGLFRLDGVPTGKCRVRALAPGTIAATSAAVAVIEDEEVRVETLRLTPAATLRGIVVTSGGEPIARAAVQANNERAECGPDGRFVVEHLPLGPCTVQVRADGMLGWRQADVDPAVELRVVLRAGLVVSGVVRDARTAAPVERFAVRVRRLRPLHEAQAGPPAWQLRHRLTATQATAATDETARAVHDELALRLARIEGRPRTEGRPPADLGPPDAHPDGRFTIDRLDEGLCEVEVLSPTHQFARSSPFALRRDEAAPDLVLSLEPACSLHGRVQTVEGRPLAGAVVDVVRASAQTTSTPGTSKFAWALGEAMPEGDVLVSTVTDPTGDFEAMHLPVGVVHVVARHAQACTAASAQVALPHGGAVELRLQPRPTLTGHVLGIPAGRSEEVLVTIGGGASQLLSARVGADGAFVFDGLEPGEYVVRAGLGSEEVLEEAFVHRVFATAADAAQRRVLLRAGERQTFDVPLTVPPAGIVKGSVRINGQPAQGCRVTLVVPDAPRPLTTTTDELGGFTVADAPAGELELRVHVRAGSMQEVHRETVRVTADASTSVRVEAATGGIDGRVIAPDGAPASQLNGDVLVLPGCTEMPADLGAYRREHRSHQVTVRSGTFRSEALTAGRALAIVRIRNREPAAQVIDIPVGTIGSADVACGHPR